MVSHPGSSAAPDVVVIGGGIIGVAGAAHLAESGRRVLLLERDDVAAGASGRNSGVVQHPFDPALIDLHLETVALYRRLEAPVGDETGLRLPPAPRRLLNLLYYSLWPLAGSIHQPGRRIGQVVVIRQVIGGQVQGLFRPPAARAQMIERQISSDAEQPTLARTLPAPLPGARPNPQECLLQQIFGSRLVTHNVAEMAADGGFVTLVKRFKSPALLVLDLFDQCLIW